MFDLRGTSDIASLSCQKNVRMFKREVDKFNAYVLVRVPIPGKGRAHQFQFQYSYQYQYQYQYEYSTYGPYQYM